MRPLPLKLWLALEDDVARHKAEINAQFAEARSRLLPERRPSPYSWVPQAWVLAEQQRMAASESGRRWHELNAAQQQALGSTANQLARRNEVLGSATLLGLLGDPRSVGWL